ncbi:pectate lyase L [Xylariaceae sp. FL0016]|nr:pectate lyase L [Xylariaceae sp. FL0016]
MLQFAFVVLLVHYVCAKDIYVSLTGADTGSGSYGDPLSSIQMAVDAAAAGDTIFLREGTYAVSTNIQIKKNGTADAPIIMTAYDSEIVVLDGEVLPYTPGELGETLPDANRGVLHIEYSNYWRFYRLTLVNGPYGVYMRDSSNNYFEQLTTHDNYESGFQMQGALTNNQIVYLDSYRNRDPRKNGESADGFACKEGSGEGNLLKGARLWDNVDDGLDLWEFKSAVTITDTISWANGFNRWDFDDFEGDGNGFKLGGGNEGEIGPANHSVTNCIAFGNAAKGFTDNSQTGEFVLSRNTAWMNGDVGFHFETAVSELSRNIAAMNQNSSTASDQVSLVGQISLSNSWDEPETWTNQSFARIDIDLVRGTREEDGRIAASDFLLPQSGVDIGATTNWQ